jgi:hypothetical protein
MVIASDSSDRREVNIGSVSGGATYEKYRFGAALYSVAVRSDTGKINHSPVAKLPGEFLMKANCKNSFKVEMTDEDGDTVKCRWATYENDSGETSELTAHTRMVRTWEDGKMIGLRPVSDFPSISLDQETCTVTYDGNLDQYCTGESSQVFEHKGGSSSTPMKFAGANHCYKPFALILEDFDEDGNVLSSVPFTFFGQVVEEGECPDDEPADYVWMDEDKTNDMMAQFVTEADDDSWGISNVRKKENKTNCQFYGTNDGKIMCVHKSIQRTSK